MKKEEDAVLLAEVMVETGRRMGKRVVALITDMDQPLGRMAGHTLEVIECVDVLSGKGPADLRELSLELCAWMFYLGERTASVPEGRRLAETMIASGQALEKFKQGIRLQGGDARVIDEPQRFAKAKSQAAVVSRDTGYIKATNCQEFGMALAMLGGGRARKEDSIDFAVGLEFHKRIGDRVEKGETLVTIHYNSADKLGEARDRITESFEFGTGKPATKALIRRVLDE